MALVSLPSVKDAKSLEEVIDAVENMRKQVEFLLDNVESGNIRGVISADKISIGLSSSFDPGYDPTQVTPHQIILSNENQSILTDSTGKTTSSVVVATDVYCFKGSTQIAGTIGSLLLKDSNGNTISTTGVTLAKTNPTGSAVGTVTMTIASGTTLASDAGYVEISFQIESNSYIKKLTWNKAKSGVDGGTGAPAKVADIAASTLFFKSSDGGTTYTPSSLTLTPQLQNVTFSKWQYSLNAGSSWTDVVSGSNGITISNGILTLANNSPLFTSTISSVVFKVITSDATVYDTITINKVFDVKGTYIDSTGVYTGVVKADQFLGGSFTGQLIKSIDPVSGDWLEINGDEIRNQVKPYSDGFGNTFDYSSYFVGGQVYSSLVKTASNGTKTGNMSYISPSGIIFSNASGVSGPEYSVPRITGNYGLDVFPSGDMTIWDGAISAKKGMKAQFTWSGRIPAGTATNGDIYITHNLGYYPQVSFNGTVGNCILTVEQTSTNQIRLYAYPNNFNGTVYLY